MNLFDLVDEELYHRMAAEGFLREQIHPTLPYRILNYTEKAQFAKLWNNVTLNSRGLIVDKYDEVIARPWKKFFNLGEGFAEFDWDSPVEVTDKMDGSLGILYPTERQVKWNNGNPITVNYEYEIATRGSFTSDQSIHATRVWKERYADKADPNPEYTFLFEIIYPANRIVLNYNGLDDLVLLGAVHIEHGYYLGPGEAAALLEWDGPVTKVFEHKTLHDAFLAEPRPNAEGYVIRSGNKMVKLKQTDYVDLHKIVTNLNERTVWSQLGEGKTVSDICEALPDEFHSWVKEVSERLQIMAGTRHKEIIDEYLRIVIEVEGEVSNRKKFAAVASKSPESKYMFMLLDNRPIHDLVWAELKPEVDKK